MREGSYGTPSPVTGRPGAHPRQLARPATGSVQSKEKASYPARTMASRFNADGPLMPKRRDSEYARAVAEAERESQYFVARHVKATVPHFRVKLDQDIAELQLAWRDMSDAEKQALIQDTIRKGKNFVRRAIACPEKPAGPTIHIDPRERERQLEAANRAMTPEQRAEFDRGGV
jgi:hypothetical protein